MWEMCSRAGQCRYNASERCATSPAFEHTAWQSEARAVLFISRSKADARVATRVKHSLLACHLGMPAISRHCPACSMRPMHSRGSTGHHHKLANYPKPSDPTHRTRHACSFGSSPRAARTSSRCSTLSALPAGAAPPSPGTTYFILAPSTATSLSAPTALRCLPSCRSAIP